MTQPKNSLAPKGNGNSPQLTPAQSFSRYITSTAPKQHIQNMIGTKAGDRFIASMVSAVSTNPAIAACQPGSIVSAALLGESLGLSPSPQLGHFYMVPFKDKKMCKYPNRKGDWRFCNKQCEFNNLPGCKTATFQLGYKGYTQLAIRSGQYKKMNVISIKEGELKRYDPLFEEIEVELIQDTMQRENTPTVGYYCMFELLNGFRKTMYWPKEKMEIHADTYSAAFKLDDYRLLMEGKVSDRDMWKYSSFWYKDFDGMAYKTMIRQLISKWGIMSIEMQQAMAGDNAKILNDGTPQYIDADPIHDEPTQAEQQEDSAMDVEPEQMQLDQQPTSQPVNQKTKQGEPVQNEQAEPSAEEEFFDQEPQQSAQPAEQDAQNELTEADLSSNLGDKAEEYEGSQASVRNTILVDVIKPWGGTLKDMERLVNKGQNQWTKKDRTKLLEAYTMLANGADPADVFPTN